MTHPRPGILERYALGELDTASRLELDSHLALCPTCRQRVEREQALDGLVLRSAGGPLPEGRTRRALDDLWATLDAETVLQDQAALPELAAQPGRTDRGVAMRELRPSAWPWRAAAGWLLLGALGALGAWWVLGDRGGHATSPRTPRSDVRTPTGVPPVDAPRAGVPPSVAPRTVLPVGTSAPPPVPPWADAAIHVDGEDLDRSRLAAVRAQVSTLLVSAQRAHADDAVFLARVTDGIAPLRADGWPVVQVVRGLLLSSSEGAGVQTAAIRWALLSGAEALLSRALADSGLTGAVLDALQRGCPTLRDDDPLAGALGAVVDRGGPHASRAFDVLVLGAADNTIQRILRGQVRRVLRGRDEREAARVAHLAGLAPVSSGLGVLLDLVSSGRAVLATERAISDLRERAPDAFMARLGEHLADDDRRAAAIGVIVRHRLDALAPALAEQLDRDEDPEPLLSVLRELEHPGVAVGLFRTWRLRRDGPHEMLTQTALIGHLVSSVEACRQLGRWSAARAADTIDELVLITRVWRESSRSAAPDAAAADGGYPGDLLAACLFSLPEQSDHDGTRALLLRELALVGTEQHGRQLLAAPPLEPQGWLAAGLLAPSDTHRAWAAAGLETELLDRALRDLGAWPAGSDAPPSRVLRRLERVLPPTRPTHGDDR